MSNARETLGNVEHWLGWQDESLSFGLRNAFDALRLYDYAQAHPNLPEMADEWQPRSRIAALGYDPLNGESHEAATTGAAAILRRVKRKNIRNMYPYEQGLIDGWNEAADALRK